MMAGVNYLLIFWIAMQNTWTYLQVLLPIFCIALIFFLRRTLGRAIGLEVIDDNTLKEHKCEFNDKKIFVVKNDAYDLLQYSIYTIEKSITKFFDYRVPLILFYRYIPNPILLDLRRIMQHKKFMREMQFYLDEAKLKYPDNDLIQKEIRAGKDALKESGKKTIKSANPRKKHGIKHKQDHR